MNILKLTLSKKWFDLIEKGIKTEEYREIKQYWVKRLCVKHPPSVIAGGDLSGKHDNMQYDIKKFELVEFTNGYNKQSPKITFEISDITIGTGYSPWGAVGDTQYFVIKLGRESSRQNIN